MKIIMTIPTYWGRKNSLVLQDDYVYDHPTPLDHEGTLQRCLESIEVPEDKNFELVVIGAATSKDITGEVEKKIESIIDRSNISVKTHLMSCSAISKIKDSITNINKTDVDQMISLNGYPSIRNLSIIAGKMMDADAVVLIDDDEVFEDPLFINKVRENLENKIYGFAGIYLNSDNDYILKKDQKQWEKEWGKLDAMNNGFKKIIGNPPRIKLTPFGFGGNMIIHKSFYNIPFDPSITRGEDIDYIINCRIFGKEFFLDNTLTIKHLPPPHSSPEWKQFRSDIVRFIYEKEKLNGSNLDIKEFAPYPGPYLKDDLLEKIEKASMMLANDYKAAGNFEGEKEALENIKIANKITHDDAYDNFIQFQNKWENMLLELKMQQRKVATEKFVPIMRIANK